MTVLTDTEVTEVKRVGGFYAAVGKKISTGETVEATASAILLAAGRKSNADTLNVENTGVKTDDRGYIKVDDFFETSQKNIWAFGDILGISMFRHVANRQALITWHNAMHKEKMKMDFQSAPHAIFTSPQIASVGLTEEQAVKQFKPGEILIGRSRYSDVVMGEAMAVSDGFAKALVEKKTGRILGFHMIGPSSSALIQEVINMIAIGGDAWALGRGMHIHPALPELIISTLNNLHEGH